jgi:hypothetical protein
VVGWGWLSGGIIGCLTCRLVCNLGDFETSFFFRFRICAMCTENEWTVSRVCGSLVAFVILLQELESGHSDDVVSHDVSAPSSISPNGCCEQCSSRHHISYFIYIYIYTLYTTLTKELSSWQCRQLSHHDLGPAGNVGESKSLRHHGKRKRSCFGCCRHDQSRSRPPPLARLVSTQTSPRNKSTKPKPVYDPALLAVSQAGLAPEDKANDEFLVEDLLEKRVHNGKTQYLVS